MVLNIGDTERIAVAVVIPANATLKTFDWKSSNEKVASVSQTGEVKGVSAGTAVIMVTAKDGSGVTGSCTVTVKKKETVTPTPTPNPESRRPRNLRSKADDRETNNRRTKEDGQTGKGQDPGSNQKDRPGQGTDLKGNGYT